MFFKCERLEYNAEEHWDEFVSITFVDHNNYVALTSIVYEDELGVEVNDQTNCLTLLKRDLEYSLTGDTLQVSFRNVTLRNNMPADHVEIELPKAVDSKRLEGALRILVDQKE